MRFSGRIRCRAIGSFPSIAVAILFSVVVSCKLAGVDPFTYLRDVRLRVATHPRDRVGELIPRAGAERFGTPALEQAQPAA